MVWQAVPQKVGELVYSQPYTPPAISNTVNIPRTAYGNTNIQRGEPGSGKKNLARRSLNFFIVTSSTILLTTDLVVDLNKYRTIVLHFNVQFIFRERQRRSTRSLERFPPG